MENHSVELIIDQLINNAQEVYPKARIERIKERTENVWYHRDNQDRIVHIFMGTAPDKDIPPLPDDITPDQKELIYQLQSVINHSKWDDDFFPALSPGLKQIIIPSYFGCIEEIASASTRVKPAIHDPSDVYNLPDVGFVPDNDGGVMLEKMKYFHQRTKGLFPLFEADMQGPFSVASQIWGVQNFLIALYDSPKEVHYLLQRTTNAVIEYMKLMDKVAEGDLVPYHCMPVLWYPREKGVAVSEDLAAVVSPKTIKEFVRPYLEQIAEAFGGVVMHSCGSINHVIGELNQIKGLVGLNFSSTETDLPLLAKTINPNIAIVCHNSPVHRPDLPLLSQLEHIVHCKKVFTENNINGICLIFPWNADPDPELDAKTYRNAATL